MGHAAIAVLDGGLPKWMKHGGSCTLAYAQNYRLGNFKSKFDPRRLKNASAILENICSGKHLVIDAKNQDRFLGKVPEPRIHLKRGHIPKSVNLPLTKLLKDGKFLTQQELKTTFKDTSVGDYPILFSYGSSITACILLFAANLVLENELSLYDGAWLEWGEGDEYPVK
jgi:thiosulfate/3-mercaptopyruvate sulfurtransferase